MSIYQFCKILFFSVLKETARNTFNIIFKISFLFCNAVCKITGKIKTSKYFTLKIPFFINFMGLNWNNSFSHEEIPIPTQFSYWLNQNTVLFCPFTTVSSLLLWKLYKNILRVISFKRHQLWTFCHGTWNNLFHVKISVTPAICVRQSYWITCCKACKKFSNSNIQQKMLWRHLQETVIWMMHQSLK